MGKSKSKLVAFLLSAFVMPGSGQSYLGRKTLGTCITLVTLFLVFYPVTIFFMDVMKHMNGMNPGNSLAMLDSLYAITGALERQKSMLTGFTYALLIVWALNLLEIIFNSGPKN